MVTQLYHIEARASLFIGSYHFTSYKNHFSARLRQCRRLPAIAARPGFPKGLASAATRKTEPVSGLRFDFVLKKSPRTTIIVDLELLVPPVGLEPTTHGLTVRRSTD